MFGYDLSRAGARVPATDEDGARSSDELVLTPAVTRTLREALVQTDEIERTAFVRCTRSGDRFLAAAADPVPDAEMVRQGRTECRPELDVERRRIHDIATDDGCVLHVHSHPFTDIAGFSGADRQIMPKVVRWVEQTYGEDQPILFGVLGRENLRVTRYDRATETFTPVPVSVLGGWTLDRPLTGAAPFGARPAVRRATDGTEDVDARFDRNLRAFGDAGQRRLLETDVAVVGVGGLGSSVAEQLARIGVGHVHLIDPDHLEASNVPRVYGTYDGDVGIPKVEAVRLHLQRINPGLTVTTHRAMVEDEAVTDALQHADAVVAGLDRMSSRGFVNQFCVRHGLPYFDAGVVIETADDTDDGRRVTAMNGFVQSVVPGTTACFDCLDRIDPQQTRLERLPDDDLAVEHEEGYVDGAALTPEPAVVTLNTTVAGMLVSEFVNFVTGVRPPRGFVHYDALEASVSLLDTEQSRSPRCHTCGRDGVLFRGTDTQSASELPERVDTDLASIPTPAPMEEGPDGAAQETAGGADATGDPDQPTTAGGSTSDTSQESAPERSTGIRWSLQEVFPWIR